MADQVSAVFVLEYDYHRSCGAVIGEFLHGLKSKHIQAAVTSADRKLVPPLEYDPHSGDAIRHLAPIGSAGVITTWAWVARPLPSHPLKTPFAFALIRLDGADSDLLHLVAAASPDHIKTGMRVAPKWRAERTGSILDIEYFIAAEDMAREAKSQTAPPPPGKDAPPAMISCPTRLEYHLTASLVKSRFLKSLQAGELFGTRCPQTEKVYFPPRAFSPVSARLMTEEVKLPDSGIVTSFCIVRFEFPGQILKPPYACAYILLDGADVPFLHLVRAQRIEDVRMGLHVSAVWLPPDQRQPSMQSIRYFEPDGKPDAPFESYKEHL